MSLTSCADSWADSGSAEKSPSFKRFTAFSTTLRPLRGDLDQHGAAVGRMRQAPDEAAGFEAVDRTGHRARGDPQAGADLAEREGMARSAAARAPDSGRRSGPSGRSRALARREQDLPGAHDRNDGGDPVGGLVPTLRQPVPVRGFRRVVLEPRHGLNIRTRSTVPSRRATLIGIADFGAVAVTRSCSSASISSALSPIDDSRTAGVLAEQRRVPDVEALRARRRSASAGCCAARCRSPDARPPRRIAGMQLGQLGLLMRLQDLGDGHSRMPQLLDDLVAGALRAPGGQVLVDPVAGRAATRLSAARAARRKRRPLRLGGHRDGDPRLVAPRSGAVDVLRRCRRPAVAVAGQQRAVRGELDELLGGHVDGRLDHGGFDEHALAGAPPVLQRDQQRRRGRASRRWDRPGSKEKAGSRRDSR